MRMIVSLGLLAVFGDAAAQNVVCDRAPSVTLVNPVVLGNGMAGSVTTAQLQAALDAGGQVRLDIGGAASTLAVTQTLSITRAVVLDAGGARLSGANARRVFRIANPSNATYAITLQNLVVANGDSRTAPGDDQFEQSGAGILKTSGGPWQAVSLDLVDCAFLNGTAVETAQDGGGGGAYLTGMDRVRIRNCLFEGNRGSNGGAFYSLGSRTISIADSVFVDNQATGNSGNPGNGGNAGAIGVDGAMRTFTLCDTRVENNIGRAYGAGFFSVMYDTQSFTGFSNATFSGNQILAGFGFAAGAYVQGGPFAVETSTFAANTADGFTGLFVGPGATGRVVNSTFASNVARQGLGAGIAHNSSVPLLILNTTIAGNSAGAFAAGITTASGANGLTLQNVVLANNTGGNAFVSWGINNAAQFDGGGNVQWPMQRPNGGAEVRATSGALFADPLLAPLANNGGPTPTQALGAGSPAIDRGNGAGAPSSDQRGMSRCGVPDSGAYETSAPGMIFCNGYE